jgi:outer membrane protein OmpA-like peptidoglycan-associated protein/tetratricopeptide (TPR) repeat protein
LANVQISAIRATFTTNDLPMMGKLFSILLTGFCCLASTCLRAQWYDPDKVGKKAGTIYGQAYEEAQNGQYAAALQHLGEALQLEPRFVDAWLSRASVHASLKNYPASVKDFETGLQLDSLYARPFLLPYSISLAGNGQFQAALDAVNRFLNIPQLNKKSVAAGKYRQKTYRFALDYAAAHPAGSYVFAPRNMGDSINSAALEYFPSLTIDGSTLIFTRRVNNDEDFYESSFANGQWRKAQALGGRINTNLNEGAQNISQDGQLLVFTGCNYPEGNGSCDLYFAVRNKTGWTEPQNLGGLVNTDYWESSPSLSPDKRELYFASSFPEGYGGKDIFVSRRLPNGKWGRPVNLGPTVNTSGDESCPFIHADNQTLFFNSNGHPGYGQTDLFLSRRVNDTLWGKPENLGYPINTIDDQGSLIVAADGRTAIYASEASDTRGGLDLYSFTLRNDLQAAKTLWVKGRVYDKKTGAGLPSTVELADVQRRRLVSKLQTDEEGNYLVTLPLGNTYAFSAARPGYLFYSDNFSLPVNTPDSIFRVDIPLQPILPGATVVLKNIFFDSKKFDLKPESVVELDKLAVLLNENPKLKIQLAGHTDNVGKPKDNLLLSNNRAKAVVNYLIGKGIAANRLTGKGFGAAQPLADNKTEAGRMQNRRTEMSVVSNL